MGLAGRCFAREGARQEPLHREGASPGTIVEGWGLLGTDALRRGGGLSAGDARCMEGACVHL
jgi:hypothetical protein